MDSLQSPDVTTPEVVKETRYTGSDIETFFGTFRQQIKPALSELDDNKAGVELSKLFPDPPQAELAQNIGVGLNDGMEKVVNSYNKLIPKDPIRALFWVFVGPLAKIDQEKSGAEQDLDTWSGDVSRELNPLLASESVQVSTTDMKEVGNALGELIANHALAGRKLTELNADKGELGRTRNKWSLESKDKLRLLDTFLKEFTKQG